ncbi:hypothetical protein G6F65_020288 [Rhizopus arrhizus]|nr:hypothetical protein G6F65_020288 [Rhizopus arrhizus]
MTGAWLWHEPPALLTGRSTVSPMTHQDVERLLAAFRGIRDACLRVHARQREAALELDAALLEDGGQHLTSGLLQEQAVAQELRRGGVGVDDFDFVAHAATAQIVVQHQGGFDGRDAALVGHVRRLREGDADEDATFVDLGQPVGQLARRRP